jgi:hypothetical protein
MSSTTVGKAINMPVLAGGIALMLAGYALYRFFSPSPHGLLEILVALPVFCIGLAFTGISFLTESAPRLRIARRCIGGVLVFLAASPILYLAWLFVR